MNPQHRLALEPIPRLRSAVRNSSLFSPARGEVVLARAPGRLDIMGGVADYSGSLVCEMPLAVAAGAAVQRRDDDQIVCQSAQEAAQVQVPAAILSETDPAAVRRQLEGKSAWARYPIGCAWWLARHGASSKGLTILLDSSVPLGGGVSSSAAIEVATMNALAGLLNSAIKPLELAVACQEVENRVVGAPCGVMDQVTSMLGQSLSLLKILCQPGSDGVPAQVLGQLQVPPGYTFVGIHSGVRHEVSGDPYTDTRVAAFMGRRILSTLEKPDLTGGCLARVDAGRYAQQWRFHLPQSITGKKFLNQYGQTGDPVTSANPDKTYAVRAATDHGVYEMVRVSSFVAMLEAAAREGPAVAGAMQDAGQLMYESHVSYSQCANLGHPMTDLLVELVRGHNTAGLLGAKITGGGCGGTVAVMLRDQPQAHDAIETIREKYTRQTGRPTMLFAGSGPGGAAWGAASLKWDQLL